MQVSAAASAHIPVRSTGAEGASGPGNSANSVGHRAKAAVAEALANGATLPANAQGLAASTIAHGGDVSNIFAAFIPAAEPPAAEGAEGEAPVGETPVEGTGTEGEVTAGAETPAEEVTETGTPAEGETTTPGAESGAGTETDLTGTDTSSAATALALLSYGADYGTEESGAGLDLAV